ncbi:MAG: phospho-sugar mutase [Clostridia bacterium]|nr:phospho-sugar mutase [Clostridia bacterium]
MNYNDHYNTWKKSQFLSDLERSELLSLTDEKAIEDRFCAPLSFGTAGLRGIAEMGLNRLNRFTLCQAVRAFGKHLAGKGTVIVCRDARLSSPELAAVAACALAELGVPVLFFKDARPTPQLSFAVRHFKAAGGLNITASHNPKEYNGCKFYDEKGAQLGNDDTDRISKIMAGIPMLAPMPEKSFEEYLAQGRITYAQCDEAYIQAVLDCRINADALAETELSAVYTAFHGVGGSIMPQALKRAGFENVYFQPEQMIPDGNFPTLDNPNPEHTPGLALSIKLAQEKSADLVCATDPDADRAAIAVADGKGGYVALSGNQTGALLTDYLLSQTSSQKPMAIIKTIVSTPLVEAICDHYGARCYSTFTGFKNMAEKLEEIESTQYCPMCFEESIGYMIGSHVRDKDGISAILMVCEMAAYYKKQGKTLLDVLNDLYSRYGRFEEHTVSLYRYGVSGQKEIAEMMKKLRNQPPKAIAGLDVESVGDYLTGENTHISGSNVLEFRLSGGSRLLIRPSGTEPKIKIYALARDFEAKALTDAIKALLS